MTSAVYGRARGQAAMVMAKRIKRWCGQEAYERYKATGEIPDDLPSVEEGQQRAKAEYKERNREKIRESERMENLSPERAARKRVSMRAAANRFYHKDVEESRARGRDYAFRRRHHLHGRDQETTEYGVILLKDPCSYCGSSEEITRDHIDPVSGGGLDHWENLTSACRRCNSSKRTTPFMTFLLRRRV